MASLQSELARLLAPDLLQDLDAKSLDEIRTLRAECQSVEVALSYLRRLAQGRLDIVHATFDRQASGQSTDSGGLVTDLADILTAGHERPSGPGRLPTLMSPNLEIEDLTAELDGILSAQSIGELTDRTPDELQKIATRIEETETRLSNERRAMHELIDHLQAEIVSRYKSGRATVDELLT